MTSTYNNSNYCHCWHCRGQALSQGGQPWPLSIRVYAVHLVDRGKAEAGAREELWWGGLWALMWLLSPPLPPLQDPGCANQALISKKLNDYRKVR